MNNIFVLSNEMIFDRSVGVDLRKKLDYDNVELKKIKQPIKKPIHVCMYGAHIYRYTAALIRVELEM